MKMRLLSAVFFILIPFNLMSQTVKEEYFEMNFNSQYSQRIIEPSITEKADVFYIHPVYKELEVYIEKFVVNRNTGKGKIWIHPYTKNGVGIDITYEQFNFDLVSGYERFSNFYISIYFDDAKYDQIQIYLSREKNEKGESVKRLFSYTIGIPEDVDIFRFSKANENVYEILKLFYSPNVSRRENVKINITGEYDAKYY